jgi:integrase
MSKPSQRRKTVRETVAPGIVKVTNSKGTYFKAIVSFEGQKRELPLKYAAKADAARARRKALAEKDEGIVISPTRGFCFDDAFELLLADARANCADGTVDYYESQVRQLRRAFNGGFPFRELTRAHVRKFTDKRSRQVSKASVAKNLRTLHRMQTLAAEAGVRWPLGEEPVRSRDVTQAQKRHVAQPPDWFEWGELCRIVNVIRNYDEKLPTYVGKTQLVHDTELVADVVTALAHTGARIGEFVRLPASNVNFKRGTVSVCDAKQKPRDITISEEGIAALGRLKLRAYEHGIAGSESNVRRCVRTAKYILGEDQRMHPHALRHSIATHLAKTRTEAEVAYFLGNSSAMVQRYFHVSGTHAKAIAATASWGTEPAKKRESAGQH